jgi:hypothetical protein
MLRDHQLAEQRSRQAQTDHRGRQSATACVVVVRDEEVVVGNRHAGATPATDRAARVLRAREI